MKKYLLAGGTAVAVMTMILLQRPFISDAAVSLGKITDATFVSVTRDDAGRATAVTVRTGEGESVTDYMLAITSTSLIKDKQGLPMNSKYLAEGDTVSIFYQCTVTNGGCPINGSALIKLIDKSVWRATLTGAVTEVNDETEQFGFRVDKLIREISQNASYSLTIRGQDGMLIRQLEIRRTGRVTTRTQATKAWADIDASQLDTVTGYWNAVGKYITATRIQLPDLKISS